MSNMSYCRFENTSNDLRDCLEAMQEFINNKGNVDEHGDALSKTELNAMHDMRPMVEEFIELYEILLINNDFEE
jgi:hypothetical protein